MRSQGVRRIVREEMAKVELEREEQRLAEGQRAADAFRERQAERNERLLKLLEARRVHGWPEHPGVEALEMRLALEDGIFPGDPGSLTGGRSKSG